MQISYSFKLNNYYTDQNLWGWDHTRLHLAGCPDRTIRSVLSPLQSVLISEDTMPRNVRYHEAFSRQQQDRELGWPVKKQLQLF